jgi:hypothetical protein
MIVIATNNGMEFLPNLLSDLEKFNITEEISIIDTQSSDSEFIDYLENLKSFNKFKLKINIYKTPYKGFDTGAYIYAIQNLKSDRFIFLQDSIRIKSVDFFNLIEEKLKISNVVTILTFDGGFWGSQNQIDFSLKHFGTSVFETGIFGPMFSISYIDSQKLNKNLLIYPENKEQQNAMERCWCIIFKEQNFTIDCLEGSHIDYTINNDEYKYFTKIKPNRT